MAIRAKRGRPPHDDVLTPAEWRVVHAVQHGMSNREIARRRGISLDAVKYHVANAMAKLGLEDRKALRNWFRAPARSALRRRREESMSATFVLGPIGQISRTVRDIKQSEQWYRDVLGVPHLYTFDKLAFFDCGGTRLFLTQAEAPQEHESILYLRVSDIALAHRTLQERGVEFVGAPHMIHKHGDETEEWMAVFKDLEGRPLAIMSQVKA
jgi:DNA-binding CsgD family transcriptional regulator/catechol 2,3-dioxygenase-like lactoylglutathione lyase family enzyme